MLVCPGCRKSEAVQVAAAAPDAAQRWSARCELCDHAWSFDD
ncbi:hypothetical protein QDR37_01695 [Amnibacterium sp. CER49]|nr:hypothetical protein [Amnibacterium sp. CER49]MDH2442649.1 hypothetical protein [Amnibacterium sp. CER49]